MGMGNISLNIFDKIKNVAKHPAHAKHSTTFAVITQTSQL